MNTIVPLLPGGRKVYRFALFGGTESGKTCLLAALGLTRPPHPEGHSCTRIGELETPPPAGHWAGWDLRGDPVAAFYYGSRLIGAGERQIKQGNVPEATDKQPPYLLLYEFTDSERRTFTVEMLDYSGELTKTDLMRDDLAVLLREQLKGMDALLVIAEAPLPGEDDLRLSDGLENLCAAFLKVQETQRDGGKSNAPVALLLNKFDRRCPPSVPPEQREANARMFLADGESPVHSRLERTLRGAVAPESFKVFAVSAFGEARLSDRSDGAGHRQELPRPGKLMSYGLEDAFVWASRRRDEIDLARYREEAGKVWGGPLGWLAPYPGGVTNMRRMAGDLVRQLPEGTPEREEVKRGHARAGWMWMTRTLSLAASLLLLLGGGALGVETYAFDGPEHRRVQAVVKDDSSTKEQHAWARQWLSDYVASDPWRHVLSQYLVVDRRSAGETLAALVAGRDDALWKRVNGAGPDRMAQVDAAEQYLEEFPESGQHTAEVQAILNEGRRLRFWKPFSDAEGDAKVKLAREALAAAAKLEDGKYLDCKEGAEARNLVVAADIKLKQKENEDGRRAVGEALARVKARGKGEKELAELKQIQERLSRLPTHKDVTEPAEEKLKREALIKEAQETYVVIATAVREEHQRQTAAYLTTMERAIDDAKASADFAALEAGLVNAKVPHLGEATPELKERLEKTRSRLLTAKARVEKDERWRVVLASHDKSLEEGEVVAAAQTLGAWPDKEDAAWVSAKEGFSGRAAKAMEKRYDGYRGASQFEKAHDVLDDALQSPAVKRLIDTEGRAALQRLLTLSKEGWGRQAYIRYRESPTLARGDAYLSSKADQRMGDEVRAYQAYLRKRDEQTTLTVKVGEIEWNDWWHDYKNKIQVDVDGKRRLAADVKSVKKGVSRGVGTGTFTARPGELVKVLVQVWNEEGAVGLVVGVKRPGGMLEFNCEAEDLHNRWVKLGTMTAGHPHYDARVRLEVAGLPSKPTLPPWKE